MTRRRTAIALLALALCGCRSGAEFRPSERPPIDEGVRERLRLGEPGEGEGTLGPIHVLGRSEDADREGVGAPSAAIELGDVIRSVDRHFPLVLAAREELEIAAGRLQGAAGSFDTVLSARRKSTFEGDYEKDLSSIEVRQATPNGGATFGAGYRLGTGEFAVYDGGLKTNEDGELWVGVDLPLLRNRAVDRRRVALWKARVERASADPYVERKRLEVGRKAANAYWRWVSAGRVREIARRLLALAEDRTEQVELAVQEGLLAPVAATENQRLIVDRRAKLASAERDLQEAAIALSLYWRDEAGRPAVPRDEALPYEFPSPRPAEAILVPSDESFALDHRPEVKSAELRLDELSADRSLAENSLQPTMDLGLRASQDLGDAVNDPDDKGELEWTATLLFDVPLQRRRAKGRVRETNARYARAEHELRFVRETVVAEIQDARSSLIQSWFRIDQARENVRLANELAEAERFQLSVGESDLLRVNLREQQAAVAAGTLVDAHEDYFRALVDYRAAMGITDPD